MGFPTMAINGNLWTDLLFIKMEFQVARLQEIVNKIQYFSKLNFKNSVDIQILLEADGLDIVDINKLIAAGVKKIGFSSLDQYIQWENMLLPCARHYLGQLEGQNLTPILANFNLIESVSSLEEARLISDLNARAGRVSQLLIKLNVLSDIKKYGFIPAEIGDASYEIALLSGVRLIGINSYVPPLGNNKLVKAAWRKIGTVFKLLQQRYRGFEVLSLNHADNLAELIEEGVNEIRIGVKSLV